ncbi:hypothetical protein RUND412_002307, partial [Rhizina undulata]
SLFALYLRAHGTHLRAIDMVHNMGASVSGKQLNRCLRQFAQSGIQNLKADVLKRPRGISTDNVNRRINVRDQRMHHKAYMDNSTTVFAWGLQGMLPGLTYIPKSWLRRGARISLTAADMVPDPSAIQYCGKSMRGILADVLCDYVPFIIKARKENPLFRIPKIRCLPLKTLEHQTFELMRFNQNELQGSLEVLEHCIHNELGLTTDCLMEQLILYSGDQLTRDWIRSLLKARA